jgi:subtilisin family serine protease
VAGIVAASLDGAGVAGLANEVSIVSVRVLDASGSGDTATIARGILQAVDTGARVVNLSLGGGYSQVVHSAVQYALDRGVTVVAAGGNQYQEGNPTTYPAAHAGVIGVSAMGPEGHSSWFANTGSYIDIAAPGEDVLSTVPGGRWGYADGTSMAAPFVSAAAALVRAANPTLSRAGVDSVLLATARDDSSGNGRDHLFGEGLLQADRAAAEAAGAAGGLHGPAARVSVWPVSGASKLRVDVDPDRGRGYWSFRVQRKAADGSWRDLRAYRTAGARERRTLNLRGGSYRVVVKAQHGHRGVTSAEVYLRR